MEKGDYTQTEIRQFMAHMFRMEGEDIKGFLSRLELPLLIPIGESIIPAVNKLRGTKEYGKIARVASIFNSVVRSKLTCPPGTPKVEVTYEGRRQAAWLLSERWNGRRVTIRLMDGLKRVSGHPDYDFQMARVRG